MRLVKVFLVGLTGLFIFITLLSLMIPGNPRVTRTVLINAPAQQKLYEQVSDLKNWKNWHPLFIADSAKLVCVNENAAPVTSCTVLYKGKTVQLQVTKADSAAVVFLISADGENDITNQVDFSPVPQSSQVKVSWTATTHLHWYPWEKFYAIFIDKLTGPGYEQALEGLKGFVENGKE